MPEINVNVDIEVWCGICGAGICRYSSSNGNAITATCPDCEEKIAELEQETEEKDQIISELKKEIEKLETEGE